MLRNETYIVCNANLVHKLKKIEHFEFDLGLALMNGNNKFNPGDIRIHTHFGFFGEIINKLGNIGSLQIYSKSSYNDFNTIIIYNQDNHLTYTLNENMSMYENINESLNLFFEKFDPQEEDEQDENIPQITHVEKTLELKKEVYVKPNKPFSEMTQEERILFARNRK